MESSCRYINYPYAVGGNMVPVEKMFADQYFSRGYPIEGKVYVDERRCPIGLSEPSFDNMPLEDAATHMDAVTEGEGQTLSPMRGRGGNRSTHNVSLVEAFRPNSKAAPKCISEGSLTPENPSIAITNSNDLISNSSFNVNIGTSPYSLSIEHFLQLKKYMFHEKTSLPDVLQTLVSLTEHLDTVPFENLCHDLCTTKLRQLMTLLGPIRIIPLCGDSTTIQTNFADDAKKELSLDGMSCVKVERDPPKMADGSDSYQHSVFLGQWMAKTNVETVYWLFKKLKIDPYKTISWIVPLQPSASKMEKIRKNPVAMRAIANQVFPANAAYIGLNNPNIRTYLTVVIRTLGIRALPDGIYINVRDENREVMKNLPRQNFVLEPGKGQGEKEGTRSAPNNHFPHPMAAAY